MSFRLVVFLFIVNLLILLIGTQIPDLWRNSIEKTIDAPDYFSSLMHFLLFFSMALLLLIRPIALMSWWVFFIMLSLAASTEGLQYFAIDRHPRWLDVGIDMSGMLLAFILLKIFYLIDKWLNKNKQDC